MMRDRRAILGYATGRGQPSARADRRHRGAGLVKPGDGGRPLTALKLCPGTSRSAVVPTTAGNDQYVRLFAEPTVGPQPQPVCCGDLFSPVQGDKFDLYVGTVDKGSTSQHLERYYGVELVEPVLDHDLHLHLDLLLQL